MGGALPATTAYRLHQRVGQGGMATVHLGTMVGPAGERRVAIKQLVAESALDVDARRRLIDEARLVFQLTHANICQVFDLASSADGTFVVMEFVEGLDLRALCKRGGALALPHALYIAREVARALDYAHRRRDDQGQPLLLVHGDVTPANVLLSCEGEVKLADFGIARVLGRPADREHRLAGTPGFVAPELRLHGTSQRADLYALGITLYIALTGQPPGSADFAPQHLRRARSDASPELEQIVAHATAPDPARRIASAAQLEQALAVELARRFAGFTPSSLARVVREHYVTPVDQHAANQLDSVLESMTIELASGTATEIDRPRPRKLPQAAPERAPSATQTAPPTMERRRWLVLPAFLIGAALAAIAAVWWWPHGGANTVDAAAPAVAVVPVVSPADAAPAVAIVPPADAAPAVEPAPVAPPAPPPPRPHNLDHRPPRRPPAAPKPAELGYLTVTARSWGAVYVDDKQVAPQTPLYRLAITAGHHRVKLFQPTSGEYTSAQDVDVHAGAIAEISFK